MAVVVRRRLGLLVLALLIGLAVSFLLVEPAAATTYTVNDVGNDSDQTPGNDACLTAGGVCTLRAAIEEANAHAGPDRIEFNITGPGPGPSYVISVTGSDLPAITGQVTIDGLSQPTVTDNNCPLPAFPDPPGPLGIRIDGGDARANGLLLGAGSDGSSVRGLSVTNFTIAGILAGGGSTGQSITCSYLGVDADGVNAGTNGNGSGASLFSGTGHVVGGLNVGEPNLIARNTNGVEIQSTGGNVQGNRIYGNTFGVLIGGLSGGASNNTVEANTISGSGQDGVAILAGGGSVVGNRVTQNLIFNNGVGGTPANNLGIDLVGLDGVNGNDGGDGDPGANNLQNFPVLTSATSDGVTTTVTGTLDSAAGNYSVEYFSNPTCDASGNGEGEVFLGSLAVTLPVASFAFITPSDPSAGVGRRITATATNLTTNDTSEFSGCATVQDAPQPGPTLTVTTDADTDDGICGPDHCTLREAINRANALAGANTIAFNIPGPAPHVINVESLLPSIEDPVTLNGLSEPDVPDNACPLPTGRLAVQIHRTGFLVIGGLGLAPGSAGSTIRGLSITNFTIGISVDGSGHSITCNYLGLAADGSTAQGNSTAVMVNGPTGVKVGGPNDGDGNVFAGNGSAVAISGGTGHTVQGNTIRNNTGGGVGIANSNNNAIVDNTIRNNGLDGVGLRSGTGNLVSRNSIVNNGDSPTQLGIDLTTGFGGDGVTQNDIGDGDGGTKNQQNFPVLARASVSGGSTTVVGALDSAPGAYTIELFSNAACDPSGNGEGETYLGNTVVTIDPTTNPTGQFSATLPTIISPGQVVTATATRNAAPLDTSEFSACRAVTGPPGVTVTQSGGSTAVTEGGTTDTFQVRLNAPPTANVTIQVTSTPAGQIQPIANLVFMPANWNVEQTVTVAAIDDTTVDGPHNATITLTATSTDPGYTGLPPTNVSVSIADNDTPGFAINDPPAVTEGDTGISILTFTVTLNPPPTQQATVRFTTANGPAPNGATGGAACAPGVDYLTTSGTLTFLPTETSKTIVVTVCADAVTEPNETVLVNLDTPTGGAAIADGQGQGTITEDDVAGALSFSASTASVPENAGSVTITVQRSGVGPSASGTTASTSATGNSAGTPAGTSPGAGVPSGSVVPGGSVRPNPPTAPSPAAGPAAPGTGTVAPSAISAATVNFATGDVTATAGQDYVPATGTLNFGVNETTKTIVIPIINDSLQEGPEQFTIVLSNPTGGASLGRAVITVTIVDTTHGAPTPPGDDSADDEREERERETEEERRQRARTNQGNRDDDAVEGDVIEVRCDLAWPAVVIANRDGAVEVKLVKEAQAACSSISVGDYLEADGEKQHEGLFHADSVEVKRRR